MLAGQVDMPRTVSGVATPPTMIPSTTKNIRVANTGTCIGRPSRAATATNTSAPPSSRPETLRR